MAAEGRRRRVTELSNELTRDIDTADPLGIVRRLCESDAQLFAGWGGHPGINDHVILDKIWKSSQKAFALLKKNKEQQRNNRIVFSGCGTSGRMAWLCSWAYNRILRKFGHTPCFHYLIAGGDRSLIMSNELPEDDPPRGAEDLMRISEGADHVMFVGITCGLSAPYVAGQINYSMQNSDMTTVLVGFNPVSLSRDAPIEKWDKTCQEVFLELEALSSKSDRAVILNPVVGPEPITGSSRMKGGSMTAILLGTVFMTALQSLLKQPALSEVVETPRQPEETGFALSLSPSLSPVCHLLDCYSQTYHTVYRHSAAVAGLLELAESCLNQPNGRLFYIGADTLGAIGLVDASEMVPTYGTDHGEFRGFVEGGWEACGNKDGDLSELGELFQVSLSQFESDVLPYLTQHDCVICVDGVCGKAGPPGLQTTMQRVLGGPAKCGLLVVTENGRACSHLLDSRYKTTALIQLPYYNAFGEESVFAAFGLKLVLNGVSTGVNILKGRVFTNEMINLRLSNDKLFERAIGIVRKWSGASQEGARHSLLKAIYKKDDITQFLSRPVSSHISQAASQDMVVPLALLLARGQGSSVMEAEEKLSHSDVNLHDIISSELDSAHSTPTSHTH